MIEVVTPLRIYAFDGRIFEIFDAKGESNRFHISFLQTIELEDRGRRGKRLHIVYSPMKMPLMYGIEEGYDAEIQNLLNAIQSAMS